jgi:hypothetical protein
MQKLLSLKILAKTWLQSIPCYLERRYFLTYQLYPIMVMAKVRILYMGGLERHLNQIITKTSLSAGS